VNSLRKGGKVTVTEGEEKVHVYYAPRGGAVKRGERKKSSYLLIKTACHPFCRMEKSLVTESVFLHASAENG